MYALCSKLIGRNNQRRDNAWYRRVLWGRPLHKTHLRLRSRSEEKNSNSMFDLQNILREIALQICKNLTLFLFAKCSDWDCILDLEKSNLLPITKLKLHFCLMNIKIQKAAYCFLSLKLIWFWPLWLSIHLKSSIFKELRVAKVSVVLEGIEGAAVGDATYIHVRALRVKKL